MLVPTSLLLQKFLANALAVVSSGNFNGELSAAKIGVFTNNVTPTQNTLYADLTKPTYTGYADQTATFATPTRRATGGFNTISAQLKFQMPDAVNPTLIYGTYITDGAGSPALLGVEVIPGGPITLADALDALYAVMMVSIGGSDFGQGEYTT